MVLVCGARAYVFNEERMEPGFHNILWLLFNYTTTSSGLVPCQGRGVDNVVTSCVLFLVFLGRIDHSPVFMYLTPRRRFKNTIEKRRS